MKKDKLHEETLRLLVFVIGVFSICILLLTFKLKVNAESPSGVLPYVVPSMQYLNDAIPYDILPNIDSDLRTYYSLSDSDTIIYFINTYDRFYDTLGEYEWNQITYIVNPTVQAGYSSSLDYLTSHVNISGNGGTMQFKWDGRFRGPYTMAGTISLLDSYTTETNSHGSFTRLYPFYLTGSDLYSYHLPDGSGDPVLIFTNYVQAVPDEFQTGHAQEPSFDSDTIIDSGLHPNVKPTFPTLNTYNITTYSTPNIDTSTVETLLESLIDVVVYNTSYVVSNIVGVIQNLWNNVSSFFEYLGDLLSYLFNRVINTIKQTADNLYQNFKGLFEPVLNSFANFINMVNTLYTLGLKDDVFDIPTLFGSLFLPNESDLDLLISTYFNEFEVFELTTTSVSSFFDNVFDLLNDDPVYSYHLPAFTFHGINFPSYEISFDWYLPYKATGDLFISAFLIVGYLYWLWVRLSGIFHGVSPDPVPLSSGEHQITGDFWTPKSF